MAEQGEAGKEPKDAGAVAPPAEKQGADIPFLLAAGIAVVAAFVLVRNLLPAKEDLSLTLRREQELRQEIDRLREEQELLEKQEEALRTDDRYKERVLRGQTGMTKPGEWIVR